MRSGARSEGGSRRQPGGLIPRMALVVIGLGVGPAVATADDGRGMTGAGAFDSMPHRASRFGEPPIGAPNLPGFGNPFRDELSRVQFVPGPMGSESAPAPRPRRGRGLSSFVVDPPLDYSGPDPFTVEDIVARDGPRVPEPMVFDLVRGLGARRGELEFNVLNLVPFRRGGPSYEWAPEVEYAVFDGFAVEYEMPIFDTEIVAHKFAAQYTIGTALDDAFIHGVQGIAFFDTRSGDFIPTLLYLAGLRLDETWSVFGMFGFAVGPQTFPFSDEPPRTGTDLITNVSLFADITDRLVLGMETNSSRQLRGSSEFLIMPQVHYQFAERSRAQFGIGMRDDVEGRHAELGFRVIFER